MKIKKGKIIQEGLGLSFFYNTMTTSMMVMPATAFDTSFVYDDIMTADFQKINVQGDISYTIADYRKAAKMVDFSYKNQKRDQEHTIAEARQKMAKRVMNLTKVYTTKYISTKNIRQVIKSADELADILKTALKEDETIQELGLQVIAISILGITPQPDTRRALEAATREEILKQQDDAIYKRCNSTIEQERIIKENELNTEIKIAEKEKEKHEKNMETKRMMQEKQAELDARRIANDIALEEEEVDRTFFPSLLLGREDIIITVGQDGLVANVMKYLDGHPLIGINPDTRRWDGILLPFEPGDLARILPAVIGKNYCRRTVTMARASSRDGQEMLAVNDLFIGPRTHTSAQYDLQWNQKREAQSSSGIIVSTGLGATGWYKSILAQVRQIAGAFGGETSIACEASDWSADRLTFVVREPYPSRSTQAGIVYGKLGKADTFRIVSRMAVNGVVFSDGMESDALEFNAGREIEIGIADKKGNLVC